MFGSYEKVCVIGSPEFSSRVSECARDFVFDAKTLLQNQMRVLKVGYAPATAC
jgi:hypothetical protein